MIQGDEKDLIGGNPSPWVWEKGYFWTNSPCFFVPNDAFYKGSLGGSYAKAWSKKVVVRVILVLWNCRKVLLDRPVPSSVLFHVGIWIMLQHSSSGAKKKLRRCKRRRKALFLVALEFVWPRQHAAFRSCCVLWLVSSQIHERDPSGYLVLELQWVAFHKVYI